MMQVALDDEFENYVICRGFDPRTWRFHDCDPDDLSNLPGIAVAKPYSNRKVGAYAVGQMFPAVIPVTRIGETAGVASSSSGHPADLDETINILYRDDTNDPNANGNPIAWLLLDSGGSGEMVMFELLEDLGQWSGDTVEAARKTWDPEANDGEGGYSVECDDIIYVGDFNEVGHTAGEGGYGTAIMHAREDGVLVGTIIDLCCPGDEMGTCNAS
jgi:hypothetical protein